MSHYTKGRLAILAAPGGPTDRQLDSWTEQRFLWPKVVGEHGSRRIFEWVPYEAAVAVMMGRLVNAGLHVRVASRIARETYDGREVKSVTVVLLSDYVTLAINTDRLDV